MKKVLLLAAAVMMTAGAAQAERYVMITHTQGTDMFWPVVEKGAKDAAAALGVELEYHFAPSGDMSDMAALIEAGAATSPDGMIISLPDPDALGATIRAATGAGIPIITINSGLEFSASLGALMHVGQPDYDAGFAAGARAKEEGATNPICLTQDASDTALIDRCQGYVDAIGVELTMIDASNDAARIQTRTATALLADGAIDALIAVGAHVCEAATAAVDEAGRSVHMGCFDLTPGVLSLIAEGKVAFSVDQQQRLQGYMPLVVLHLYNTNAGMLPSSNIDAGPGFVDKSNVAAVAKQAGTNR